jgi:hypothetical protein
VIREDFRNGPIYPFTCYEPEKGSPFVLHGDVSLEELRYRAYEELRTKNHLNEYVSYIHLYHIS